MSNELRNIEKALRGFTKRCKELKYTKELLFSFLMTGTLSYGANIKSDSEIEGTKKQITNSIDDMRDLFKEAKRENNKLLRQSNLELIQLTDSAYGTGRPCSKVTLELLAVWNELFLQRLAGNVQRERR